MSLLSASTDVAAQREVESAQRRAAQTLVAAYQISKGLSELLGSIDKPSSPMFLSAEEKQAISVAHAEAHRVFATLNQVVIDRGQDEKPHA